MSFQHNESIRAAIEAFITENNYTVPEVAKMLNLSSSTRLYKYLALDKPDAKPESDMPRVESACRHFIRHQARRKAMHGSLFETSVSKAVFDTIKQIRKTGDMGLIHGPAGAGKSCGAELYCRDQPNSVLVTATKDRRDARAMRNLVFESLQYERDTKGKSYNGYTPRIDWIFEILGISERVILVDNAQRLTLGAWEWFADLNDARQIPVVFLGNPEVLGIIRRSDQLSSRIGIVTQVKIDKDEKVIATNLVEQYAPAGNGTLVDCILDRVGEPGHARRAKKALQLTAAIHEGQRDKDWKRAFDLADAKLLKPNYLAEKK